MKIHDTAVPTKEYRDLFWKAIKAAHPDLTESFTQSSLWELFRYMKMVELAAAANMGTVTTAGIDAVSLGVSNKLQRPYLRKKVSQMVMRFIQNNPQYCRSQASSDPQENLRRVTTFLEAFYPKVEKTIPNNL